ncbi:MAG TPA: VOC family protein [Caulobacteraceae bacterium]|jgi:catechol 2,3-dioxygenase-like lactoylglutathione lyase family enzyme|nr:VOC family protein [Caulobacteraceae bacterium]
MIRIRKIEHVGLRVDDLAASEAFYTGLLGLPKVDIRKVVGQVRPGYGEDLQRVTGARAGKGAVWVQIPGLQVHLVNGDKDPGVASPFDTHLALEVEDFEEAKRTLDERGVKYVESPEGLPYRQAFLTDPTGNTIELWASR